MATLRLVPPTGAPYEIDKDEVVIGREPTVEVVVPDGSVSRKHARIVRRGAGWAVVDQGSANGTFLDSQRIADALLRNGQELRVGAITFKVEIESPEDVGATLGGPEGSDATIVQTPPALQPPPQPPPLSSPIAAPPPPPPPARVSAPPPPLPRPSGPPSPAGHAPAPVVAPMSAGPGPKKGRGPIFWTFVGCGGCLTMVVLAIALVAGGVFFMTKSAVDGVKAPLEAFRSGSVDAAYAATSESYRARVSREEFEALLDAHPALKDNADASFWPPHGSVQVVNDTAHLTGTLVSHSGVKEQVSFDLVKEGGVWKISELSVENAP